jgi:hypothetical protein
MVMIKRGRPKQTDSTDQSSKFIRTIEYKDGCIVLWYFDLNKSKNGPVEIIIEYPKTYITFEEEQEQIPLSKRKYLNPNNGKWVAYARACVLGLVDKKNK